MKEDFSDVQRVVLSGGSWRVAQHLVIGAEPWKLLHLLASKKGEVIERDVILRDVWGYTEQVRTRTLDTHVKRIREKLGTGADWLQTSRGYGYVFREPAY